MTLQQLLAQYAQRPAHSVPDWMLGFWKRYSISFANGLTDLHTHVCWLQSRNFTIDLRLPLAAQQVAAKPLSRYSAEELQVLANYEGWLALSDWDGSVLSWRDTETSLQLHNRWPEPAILKRTGNAMIEHCASNAYVEDWRLQPSAVGPLVGLHMIEEREVSSGKLRHRGGGLIVCGDYAALVLGRAETLEPGPAPLKTRVAEAVADLARLHTLFNFETSLAQGCLDTGYVINLSTRPARIGQPLFPLDGFEPLPERRLRQQLDVDGTLVERIFVIDTLEARLDFAQTTPFAAAAADWFERESPTLGRYLEVLR